MWTMTNLNIAAKYPKYCKDKKDVTYNKNDLG